MAEQRTLTVDRRSSRKAERRTLTFARLDEVMPDVERLLAGHTTVGNWSLGQICNHLCTAIRGSVEGFPVKAPWLVRKTIAKVIQHRILKSGRISEGMKVPEEYLPKSGLDAHVEAEALRSALRLYITHPGPLADHPFFGPITHDQWTRLHCIHCAHHLSFARPTEG